MNKQDARSLSSEVQQHLRYRALELIDSGQSQKAAAQALGVHHTTVCQWVKARRLGGKEGLKLGVRGRRAGFGRKLTAEQEERLKWLIVDNAPHQLKLPFALWTRKAVQALVWDRWQIRIDVRTVGLYLKRWGYTPQKPAKRAYERNPHQVKTWLEQAYPAIKQQAKRSKGRIFWCDETGVRNDSQHGRSFAPKGRTPLYTKGGGRLSICCGQVQPATKLSTLLEFNGCLIAQRRVQAA